MALTDRMIQRLLAKNIMTTTISLHELHFKEHPEYSMDKLREKYNRSINVIYPDHLKEFSDAADYANLLIIAEKKALS